MEIDAKIAYEAALSTALEKEKQLIELSALYNQSIKRIEELEKELKEARGE